MCCTTHQCRACTWVEAVVLDVDVEIQHPEDERRGVPFFKGLPAGGLERLTEIRRTSQARQRPGCLGASGTLPPHVLLPTVLSPHVRGISHVRDRSADARPAVAAARGGGGVRLPRVPGAGGGVLRAGDRRSARHARPCLQASPRRRHVRHRIPPDRVWPPGSPREGAVGVFPARPAGGAESAGVGRRGPRRGGLPVLRPGARAADRLGPRTAVVRDRRHEPFERRRFPKAGAGSTRARRSRTDVALPGFRIVERAQRWSLRQAQAPRLERGDLPCRVPPRVRPCGVPRAHAREVVRPPRLRAGVRPPRGRAVAGGSGRCSTGGRPQRSSTPGGVVPASTRNSRTDSTTTGRWRTC